MNCLSWLGLFLQSLFCNVPNFSLKLNPPKSSANNSKEIFTAAINPETASHALGLKWDHVFYTFFLRAEALTANSKTLLHSDRFLVLCPQCLTP